MDKQFPRTVIGGTSVSRMIIGTNWLLGWSHRTPSADRAIKAKYGTDEAFLPILEAYQQYGIDTVMAPMDAPFVHTIRYAEEKLGKKFILIDTPQINVDDNPAARREAEARIRQSAKNGCAFCLIHHASAEQLVVYSDENGYDVETYLQIFNCVGFLMQVEIETVASIIQNAKKPVLNIKSMAAGRITPYVGLTFNWNVLRPVDCLTLGAHTAEEVHEDVEISFAALEHRFPNLEKRASPVQAQAAFGRG